MKVEIDYANEGDGFKLQVRSESIVDQSQLLINFPPATGPSEIRESILEIITGPTGQSVSPGTTTHLKRLLAYFSKK